MRVKGQYILPKILSTLGNATIAMLGSGAHTSAGVYRAFRTFDELQAISDEKLRGTVRYILGKRYAKVVHRQGKSLLVLTESGKKMVNRAAVEALRPKTQAPWDKMWHIVLFDIPEEFKKNRDSFAANLKRMGFIQIQKSAFIFPYPCFEELEVLADFHQVKKFLTVIDAVSVSEEKKLINKFKLL